MVSFGSERVERKAGPAKGLGFFLVFARVSPSLLRLLSRVSLAKSFFRGDCSLAWVATNMRKGKPRRRPRRSTDNNIFQGQLELDLTKFEGNLSKQPTKNELAWERRQLFVKKLK